MKKLELHAFDIEDAKMQAFAQGITVIMDATKVWQRAGSPILTQELDMFMAEYMDSKNMFDFEGAGVIITITKGIEDTRKNPYTLISSRRKGRARLKRSIEICDTETNEILGVAPTKTQALKLAKKLIRKHRKDMYGKTVYTAPDLDFELIYTPSVKRQRGRYIVFGVEDADVRISKQKKRSFK